MGAGLAAAAGTMAAGMATSMGASLAVSGMVSTAAGAAFTSLVSQATVSLVNNQGDLGETFKDMGESQVWQNVAFAAVTAGVTGGVDANAGFGTQAVQLVEGAAVRSAAQSAIYGTNFGETFVDNLKTGAVYAIGANIAQGVGTWYHGEEYTAQQNGTSVSLSDDLMHISAHAAIGCGIGAAISDNCAAGAAGAAAGELGAEWSNNATVGKMSGAFAGLFTDSGAEGVYLGYDTASNAVENNAFFALRPLKSSPWLGILSNNPIDDFYNTEASHEQLFFEDEEGGNIGFFDDQKVRPDNPAFLNEYRTTKTGFDDALMREAIKNVTPKTYNLLGDTFTGCNKYNCQDWADDVRKEYRRLENNRK